MYSGNIEFFRPGLECQETTSNNFNVTHWHYCFTSWSFAR